MNSAVKIITGLMKLVAPPVAHRDSATTGSVSTTAPSRPVAVHMSPEVRSGRGPSSHRFPSACCGRLRLSLRRRIAPSKIGISGRRLDGQMAGHSKWASIKHRKKAVDAKRGALFTKLTRAITVAAREGGGDPDGNPSLALAVQKARDASMPKDNIERAIAKGTGADSDSEAFEPVTYEGYGPGGGAILVEALTDNRNRTSAEVRHAFTSHGGSLGEPGSVAWTFEKKGEIVLDAERY